MPYLNKVQLIGHLGRDAEYVAYGNGKEMAKFSVATSSGYGDKKTTEWHKVLLFGKGVEFVKGDLLKGVTVYVEGEIKTNKWTGKDGVSRESKEILALAVKVFDKKKNTNSQGHTTADYMGEFTKEEEDDIPV